MCNIDTNVMVYFPAEFLGFDHHMPPFSTANGDQILQGVNYASAGAGIRPETGKICVMIMLLPITNLLLH